jgi:hypothetical protein
MADSKNITKEEIEQEVWKEIPGFPFYEVSNLGRFRSWRERYAGKWSGPDRRDTKPHILRQSSRHLGRLYVCLQKDGKTHQLIAHRIVLLAFVGPCPEGLESCHNDGDHTNNRIDNLRWDTKESNWDDRRTHGVANIGANHGRTRLSDEDVEQIRILYHKGYRAHDIAKRYSIDKKTIVRMCTGRGWTHLKLGPITKTSKGSKRNMKSLPTDL